MRENVRGEERDTTTHLIKIHVFTHASHVTKFSVRFLLRYKELWVLGHYTATLGESTIISKLVESSYKSNRGIFQPCGQSLFVYDDLEILRKVFVLLSVG